MKYLIFGNGYIGNKFRDFLEDDVIISSADIGNIKEVKLAIDTYKPNYIINCAGKTGRPNIDWCEDHREETAYSNVVAPILLAEICNLEEIPLTHIGSGCIYQGDNGGKGFTEDDGTDLYELPSYYSVTKALSEGILNVMGNILQIRIRMPIDDDLSSPRNFIHKILKYEKVISEPNSMTIVEDMIETTIQLMDRGKTGIYNVVNSGVITHKEILDMYTDMVDPEFTYTLIPTHELDTTAGRSNCMLNTDKLEREGLELMDIKEAIAYIFLDKL